MILAIAALAMVIALVWAVHNDTKTREALHAGRMEAYTEDIDFSLLVKGYEAVNDIDIEYTQWKAKNGAGDEFIPRIPNNPVGKYHTMWAAGVR